MCKCASNKMLSFGAMSPHRCTGHAASSVTARCRAEQHTHDDLYPEETRWPCGGAEAGELGQEKAASRAARSGRSVGATPFWHRGGPTRGSTTSGASSELRDGSWRRGSRGLQAWCEWRPAECSVALYDALRTCLCRGHHKERRASYFFCSDFNQVARHRGCSYRAASASVGQLDASPLPRPETIAAQVDDDLIAVLL